MAKMDLIIEELNKLKKTDLIDIIINKKVPDGIKLSDLIKKSLKICENQVLCKCSSASLSLPTSKSADRDMTGIQNDLKCCEIELKYVKELNNELKRTVNNLETIVELLKTKNNDSTNLTECQQKYNVATASKISSDIKRSTVVKSSSKINNNSTCPNVVVTNKEVSTAILDAQTRSKLNEIIHLDGKNININVNKNKIVGTDLSDGDVAVGEKAWIFVTKYNTSYTVENLEASLRRKFSDRHFTCVQTKNNWGCNSFKIAVDLDLKDILLDGKIWPKGIEVGEYFFRKKSIHQRQNLNKRHLGNRK